MARKTGIAQATVFGPNVMADVSAVSVTANSAFYVDTRELVDGVPNGAPDERTVFIYTPAAASATLTVAAGTGYAATKDLVLSASASTPYAFTLDSARYEIASGEDAGIIKFTSDKNGTFEAIRVKV